MTITYHPNLVQGETVGELSAVIKRMEAPFTIEYLRERLCYDPLTGLFTWLRPPKEHPRLLGKEAGGKATGYVMIKIDWIKYGAHRLAWFYVHGIWPRHRIDHKDTNGLNNIFTNLRAATCGQNCANSSLKKGKILPKGVRAQGKRFVARIRFNNELINIGVFDTPEEAHAAYFSEAKRLRGEFARAA